MKFIKIILFLFAVFSKSQDLNCSKIYLIRHAEKLRTNISEKNPDLNDKGIIRAEYWKNYFSDKNISNIYSTNFKRTIKTVEPLALINEIEIILYSTDEKMDYQKFLKINSGKNSLVVGHSNTIPKFVNGLINKELYQDIDDLNNSNLYIVSICDSIITHKLIKVN